MALAVPTEGEEPTMLDTEAELRRREAVIVDELDARNYMADVLARSPLSETS